MRVLIINGSHRKGNTDLVIEKLERMLVTRVKEVRVIKLRELEMQMPDGCETCAESEICPNVNDQFSREIEPTIRDYDSYLIATPTWCNAPTPLTKIFFDRIVSWCHPDRMYLRGKRLAILTHGMEGLESWHYVIDWVRGLCGFEECRFAGVLTFISGAKVGSLRVSDDELLNFANRLRN